MMNTKTGYLIRGIKSNDINDICSWIDNKISEPNDLQIGENTEIDISNEDIDKAIYTQKRIDYMHSSLRNMKFDVYEAYK